MLTATQWQQHVSDTPIQHRHTRYMTDEQLREYPLVLMNVEGVPGVAFHQRVDG